MKASEVREKYIKFFESTPRNHKKIDPAPLVLENDPSTLFTSAGMQPLVPYLLGESHPMGNRLVNSQSSIRLGDIEEVGDNRHTTFFEMLGNWSLGDYWKEDQLSWIYEFFTKELGISKEKLWVSVFEGSENVKKDTESFEIWKKMGISEEKIVFYGDKKNWWSMTGTPAEMNIGHIGGPDSEVFYDFGEDLKIHENSSYKDTPCHPACECGRFLEIGNSVFIQYKKVADGKLEELPQKNVDFGGGLERITAVVNKEPDMYKTDLFYPAVAQLEKRLGVSYGVNENIDKSLRIFADHMRASVFLIASHVMPDNKLQGYVLRRLLRRSALKAYLIKKDFDSKDFRAVAHTIIEGYANAFTEEEDKEIGEVISLEVRKFRATVERGYKEIEKHQGITGKIAFDLYQSYGFPLELTEEIAREKGQKVDRNVFREEFEKHKNLSRTTSAGVFKGGLADESPEVVRLHTATHLLLASLRRVLGDHVVQKGQNITRERSRFDFPHNGKLSETELGRIEDAINNVISKDLPVKHDVLPKDNALKTGAIHGFNEKYADTVKVYYVGKNLKDAYSREFCGGPHVDSTGKIGRVKISKQEKIGSGLMRIYMVLNGK